MKKTELITSKEIRSYLKEQGIDQKGLFSLDRMTIQGVNQMTGIIAHFSQARPHAGGLQIMLDDEKGIETGGMGEVFNTEKIIDVDELRDRINQILDFRNYAIEQLQDTLPILDLLTDDEQERQFKVMKDGMEQIEHLNAIVKEKGSLHVSDMKLEVMGPIMNMRIFSREMMSLAEKRKKELEKQQQKDQSLDREQEL